MPENPSHQPKCNCIFCTLKCPMCDSPDVGIEFNTSYKGSHFVEDELRFINVGDTVRLTCNSCHGEIESGEQGDSQESSLKALQDAIHDVFVDDMYRVCIDKDFNITCTAYRYKPDDEGQEE